MKAGKDGDANAGQKDNKSTSRCFVGKKGYLAYAKSLFTLNTLESEVRVRAAYIYEDQ